MSIKINVYNQAAEQVGDIKLSDKVFGIKLNEALIHQAMVTQMANERQVLAHTKDRSEVRGGGKKPWRQKGTGRARAGSSRSPIWIGGGVTFGPTKDRNFKKKINQKMKQKAILMVFSDKAVSENIAVLDKIETSEFKTKIFDGILTGSAEFVLPSPGETNVAYKADIELDRSNAAKVLKAFSDEVPDIKGLLYTSLKLEGMLGAENLDKTTGTGSIGIKDGSVFSLPIFGGLTAIMEKIIPGLDFVLKQSDLKANFQIRDNKIITDCIVLLSFAFTEVTSSSPTSDKIIFRTVCRFI